MDIDICITAALRPEILHTTLESFTKNLFGVPNSHRCIMNIDPAGPQNITQDQVYAKVKTFFKYWKVNKPTTPSFPEASIWCWDQVETEFFFNLEDDWKLLAPLDLQSMINVMQNNPDVVSLRIPKGGVVGNECVQSGAISQPRYVWTGEYFRCPDHVRYKENYYGGPSLIRTSWMKEMRPHINIKLPMEGNMQLLKKRFADRFKRWRFGIYSKLEYSSKIIDDIGTPWRQAHKIKKDSYCGKFITWKVGAR